MIEVGVKVDPSRRLPFRVVSQGAEGFAERLANLIGWELTAWFAQGIGHLATKKLSERPKEPKPKPKPKRQGRKEKP